MTKGTGRQLKKQSTAQKQKKRGRTGKNIAYPLLSAVLLVVFVANFLFLPVLANSPDVSPNVKNLGSPLSGSKGIDVSKWQGRIHWDLVANDGVKYAFIRATYGDSRDPYFYANATDAHKNGIKVGAYHFARFTDSASMRKEANAFLAQLERVNITYPVVLDIENHNGLGRTQLSSLCKQFMDIIASKGYTVMLYSYENFFKDRLNTGHFKGYDLWVANYLRKPSISHSIWQHSCKGRVSGISGHVDLNRCYKDYSIKDTSTHTVTLDRSSSDAIKTHLNQAYDARIDVKGQFDVDKIKSEIALALGEELNHHFESQLPVSSAITLHELQRLEELDLHGNYPEIVSLLQSQLFYLGFYKTYPSGVFDEETKISLEEYQDFYKLPLTGEFDRETLIKMFAITKL